MEGQALREYALLAPIYDRVWRRYVRVSITETLRQLPLEGDERVLDIGCGTGQHLHALLNRHPDLALHGLDQSPAMLRRARARLGANADLVEGTADSLPYPDAGFDLIISTSVLHYLPLPHQPVIDEWRRVLAPGGRIALTDWNGDHPGTRVRGISLRRWLGRRISVLRHDDMVGLLAGADLTVTSQRRFSVAGWGLSTMVGAR